MGVEAERKFLLKDDSWKAGVADSFTITQRYLSTDPTVRLRTTSRGEAFLTIKGKAPVGSIETPEFEYPIPLKEAQAMMAFALPGEIVKTRHHVPFGSHVWEIDVFDGDNKGLMIAEIELAHGDETFEKPAWAAEEVTHDKRCKNAYLLAHPFSTWEKK